MDIGYVFVSNVRDDVKKNGSLIDSVFLLMICICLSMSG